MCRSGKSGDTKLFIFLDSRYKFTVAEWPLWCFPLPTGTGTELSRSLGPHGLVGVETPHIPLLGDAEYININTHTDVCYQLKCRMKTPSNIVNWLYRNKFLWNLVRNSNIFIQENVFENTVWKMTAILSRPQRVKRLSTDVAYISCRLMYWPQSWHRLCMELSAMIVIIMMPPELRHRG